MVPVFISYHHALDQAYKDHLVYLASNFGAFDDRSVNTGDIEDDGRSSQSIRRLIRDHYLRDSRVTILLCGAETRFRKHVDWELKSSMIDGQLNSKSGILVINVNGSNNGNFHTSLPNEKATIYPDFVGWQTLETKAAYDDWFPDLPARILDNLFNPNAAISVVPWERVHNNPGNLHWLVKAAAIAGSTNVYDLSRSMRRNNHTPSIGNLFR